MNMTILSHSGNGCCVNSVVPVAQKPNTATAAGSDAGWLTVTKLLRLSNNSIGRDAGYPVEAELRK